jgi:uncharacterized membrane protein
MANGSRRLASIDLLRGLIMALMALDHTSGIIVRVHRSEYWDRPLPIYGDFLTFFTRAITHLCAPGFFLLLGTGLVFFAASRRRAGWTTPQITRRLLLRGLLLIFLQLLIINSLWRLAGSASWPGNLLRLFSPLYVGVLACLGMSLLAGACLLEVRKEALLVAGLLIILAAQLLIAGPARGRTEFGSAARLLLVAGRGRNMLVNYPLFPWLGVTMLGMAFGKALIASPRLAGRGALAAALIGLALFCLLRVTGGCRSLPALFALVKYPPSLGFLLITLSIDLLLWRFFEALPSAAASAGPAVLLRCFGEVPLFFYVLHLAVYTLIALSVPLLPPFWAVYPIWTASLLLFYPLCRLYRNFKRLRSQHSLWRLF